MAGLSFTHYYQLRSVYVKARSSSNNKCIRALLYPVFRALAHKRFDKTLIRNSKRVSCKLVDRIAIRAMVRYLLQKAQEINEIPKFDDIYLTYAYVMLNNKIDIVARLAYDAILNNLSFEPTESFKEKLYKELLKSLKEEQEVFLRELPDFLAEEIKNELNYIAQSTALTTQGREGTFTLKHGEGSVARLVPSLLLEDN